MNKSQDIKLFTQAYNEGKQLFIFIYMNGCGHCEIVKPIWDKLSKNILNNPLYSNIKMIKIEQNDLKYFSKYIKPINSFPTFLYMSKYSPAKVYDIGRDYKSLFLWVTKKNTKGGKTKKRKRKINKTKRYNKIDNYLNI